MEKPWTEVFQAKCEATGSSSQEKEVDYFICGRCERGNRQDTPTALVTGSQGRLGSRTPTGLQLYSRKMHLVAGCGGRGRRLARMSLPDESPRGPSVGWERVWRGRNRPGARWEAVPWGIIDVVEGESEREWKLSRRAARFLVCVT